jgi:hypothetical protein
LRRRFGLLSNTINVDTISLRIIFNWLWVHTLAGAWASYNGRLNCCEIDSRFVLAATSSVEMIAATIIHEAAHARLDRCSIGYHEGIRARIETICLRREIGFARKLPNGREIQEAAEQMINVLGDPDYWSKAAVTHRELAGSAEAMRHLGTPEWLIRMLVKVACITKRH